MGITRIIDIQPDHDDGTLDSLRHYVPHGDSWHCEETGEIVTGVELDKCMEPRA